MKQIDICLMNPPYGERSNTIHFDFVQKMLQCSKEQVVIAPFNFISNPNNKDIQKYKEEFDKYLISVEEQPKDTFKGIGINDVGIYYFSDKKTGNIKINYLDGKEEELDSLKNKSNYTSYEKGIIEWLSKNDKQLIVQDVSYIGHQIKKMSWEEALTKNLKKLKKVLDENPGCCGLIVNRIRTIGYYDCFTSKNGQIYDNYEDFYNKFLENKSSSGYNVLMFRSKEAAKNAKIALQNPVIRFTFMREQTDRMMFGKVYKYVPHIDWEDERCRTDVGLLELCGCPKEKAEEYALYCKKIIEQVDKK